MRQLLERFAPWAPLALLLGIVASLVEAAEERDVSSTVLLLLSLAAALALVRLKRGLTRGEVRAEIVTGVRALVRDEARVPFDRQARVFPIKTRSGLPPDPESTLLSEAPTDPGLPKEDQR